MIMKIILNDNDNGEKKNMIIMKIVIEENNESDNVK